MAEEGKAKKPLRKRKRRTRGQKKFYKTGQKLYNFTLLRKMRGSRKESPTMRKKWRVRCVCGAEMLIPEWYFRRKSPKEHCGCLTERSKRAEFNKEYRIWLMIRERTRNPAHPAYKHYKSRNINITEEWHDLETGFELFFEDIGPRPSGAHSVDRIDNMLGYQPGNVRWATASQQRANQGDMVAGYTEAQITAAGYTRAEFTERISKGADEHALIKKGKK